MRRQYVLAHMETKTATSYKPSLHSLFQNLGGDVKVPRVLEECMLAIAAVAATASTTTMTTTTTTKTSYVRKLQVGPTNASQDLRCIPAVMFYSERMCTECSALRG